MAPRKPPPLSLQTNHHSNTTLVFESPIDLPDSPLQLSDTSSDSSSPIALSLNLAHHAPSDSTSSSSDAQSDDISKDLEVLEKLRKSVQKNLRLRPIKSSSSLPKVSPGITPVLPQLSPPTARESWKDMGDVASPASSTGSVYFTPIDIRSPPFSARYVGEHPFASPLPSSTLPPPPPSPRTRALDPAALHSLLISSHRPLLLDIRPAPTHQSSHLTPHSINLAIPSLILKRYRKPTSGGFSSLDALRPFITTDHGKKIWDDDIMGPNGHWNGSVVVYDEEMNEKDRESGGTAAWALIPLITPLLHHGSTIDFLQGGFAAARSHPKLQSLIVSDDPDSDDLLNIPPREPTRKTSTGGLFQLDTSAAARSKTLPEIEHEGDSARPKTHSPLPMMPSAMSSSEIIADSSPSPPPSQLSFRRPPPPRKPSTPNLRRLDTKSAERLNTNLPKLHIRSPPIKAATLAVPPSLYIPNGNGHPHHPNNTLQSPHSPSHLNLIHSNHSPPGSASRWIPPPSPSPGYNGQSEFLPPPSPYFASRPSTPRTPGTPMPISSPLTARPDFDAPPTTEEPFPAFSISAILPHFLYLGPELTTQEHVDELKKLGVKRIINIAVECDHDHGLGLRDVFERYFHIPMRDMVEEENITRGVRAACDILDDARLHSAPTYVHCKAGKSRSVTAVIAYLIHANHWTLSRAYSFVLERRKGISPNIGFVSELMTFEEQELGRKSVGVVQPSPGGTAGDEHGDGEHHDPHGGYGGGGGPSSRRPAHLRESLPPQFNMNPSEGLLPGPMSAGGISRVGDSGQEMEIKDATGRYRHARRAPVDEQTLQPMRRVSKAGLESATLNV